MITKPHIATRTRGDTSSRQDRIANTLRQHMADLARGTYLRELRAGVHETQQDVADAAGVSLRAYQAWEAGGKIKWENAVRLAEHFKVDPEGLVERDGASLDESQLDRIEGLLHEILARLDK